MPIYDAFISYSHSGDMLIASRLQSQMQRLGKPWYLRRALRIFRDDTSLSATPGLAPSLEVALGQSRFLVLLASTESARSRWVSGETLFWLKNKTTDSLLIVLTSGDLSWDERAGDFSWSDQTPLPSNLKGKFRSEPRWVDLRAFRDATLSADKLLPAAADLASAIHGIPKEDLLSQELTEQRRAKRLAWSAAACLLVLACAAAWEWRQAVLQRDRAENTLQAAIEGTKALVLEVGVELRQTVGIPLKVVDDIMATARDLQTHLLSYNANSQALRRAQAVTFREQSQTLYAEGKFSAALDAAKQSRDILQSISSAGGPASSDFRRELSLSDNRIGEAYSKLGQHDDALASFQAALDIRKELASASANPEQKRDLALAYERAGDEFFTLSNRKQAGEMYAESLAVRAALADDKPEDPDRREDLAVAYDRMARISEGGEALDWYDKSLAIREKLVREDRTNALWQTNYATILDTKGNMLAAAGECEKALGPLRDGIAVRRSLAERSGDVPRYQANLAMSEYHLASCGDQSRERYRDAIDILGRLEAGGSLPPNVRGLKEVAKSRLDALPN
jgi:tetratricopeptide (TPR) repeat protein